MRGAPVATANADGKIFASPRAKNLAVKLGVDLATIQSIVGHADVDMTKHYLHVQDPVRQAAIEKFAVAFSSRPASSHLNLLDLLESS